MTWKGRDAICQRSSNSDALGPDSAEAASHNCKPRLPRPSAVPTPLAGLDPPGAAGPGRTLRQRPTAFLAYFDTWRANNCRTEAINGLIEMHRCIANEFRNSHNDRLRMLLIGGGLTHLHLK